MSCVLRSRELNGCINRRSNKRLNATALSAAFINVVWGGALSAALDTLQIRRDRMKMSSTHRGETRTLNSYINGRSNNGLHASALTNSVIDDCLRAA